MSRIQFKDIRLAVFSVILGAVISTYYVNQFYAKKLGIIESELASKKTNETREIDEIYSLIKSHYYEKLSDTEIIERMVNGFDQYSYYYPKRSNTNTQESTKLGIILRRDKATGFPFIAYLWLNSPAEKAGLQLGDYIIKINGKSAQQVSDDEFDKILLNKEIGAKTDLTVLPANSSTPIQIQLTTDKFKKDGFLFVSSKLLDNGYGYIKMTEFGNGYVSEIKKNRKEFVSHINKLYEQNKSPLKGIILDLRDNPGGDLGNAVAVSGVFLPKETTIVHFIHDIEEEAAATEKLTKKRVVELAQEGISIDNKNNKLEMAISVANVHIFRGVSNVSKEISSVNENTQNVPLVVLINSNSISSSETVAAALQDHKRAVIVGEQSRGKGVSQSTFYLDSGAKLQLVTNSVSSPNHRSWHKQGIVPDIELKNDEPKIDSDKKIKDEEIIARIIQARQDKQLKKALEVLKNPSLYQASIGLAEKEGRIDRKKIVEEK